MVLAGIVPAALSPVTRACSIPVFRYALVNWVPDIHELIVFHRGPLTAPQQQIVDWLARSASEDGSISNYVLSVVDLDGSVSPETRALWDQQQNAVAPWMVLRHGHAAPGDSPVWSVPLDTRHANAMVDSPVRGELADRILDGASAVWLLLEIGDPDKDNATAELLSAELKHVNETLRPSASPDERTGAIVPAEQTAISKTKVLFSMVRLSRDDPAEELLTKILLDSEDDLRTYQEPMAFPVFGRGRVLYALVGKGMNRSNIMEACRFLVDGCQCQVKAENPGTDLVMRVDWDAGLMGEWGHAPPLAALLTPPATSAPSGSEPGGRSANGSVVGGSLLRNSLLVLACGVLAVGIAAVVILRRARSRA